MSSLVGRYESFLVQNVSTISSLESSIRSLTWFLPGRFKDAELASELLSAFLNALSMYHDTLLARVVQADPKYKPLLPSSQHARYTRAWCEKDVRYKWVARALELLRFTELVIEMGLRRKVSVQNKWRGIVLIELIKACLRLILLRITRRPLVSPLIPEREFDPSTLPPSTATSPTLAPSSPPSSPPATPEHLKNNHIPLPTNQQGLSKKGPHPLLASSQKLSVSPVEDYLLPKALTTTSVRTPACLITPLCSSVEWASEVIHICRPLIYAAILSRYRDSARPFQVLLVAELLARNLRRSPTPSSALERGEYARRDRDVLWHLLRGPIWKSWTRPKLEHFADRTANSPLLGLAGALVKDWVPLIDEYYYYTAP